MTDRLAIERRINEGGGLAPEAMFERELRAVADRALHFKAVVPARTC